MTKQDATVFPTRLMIPGRSRRRIDTFDRVELLKTMFLSREGDRREGVLHRQGKGWFQVSGIGHEPMAALAMLMKQGDYMCPYYRDRSAVLALGITNLDLARSYFAKATSSSAGRQMPGHYSDRQKNIWSVPTPTGANLLPACGIAWSMQLAKRENVVVATIGDASTRQGEFYEAVAFATERKLPVVFIVEDNNYGISTNTTKFNPFKLNLFNPGIFTQVDARDPDLFADHLAPILAQARSGGGPAVVVAEFDRICSHTCSDDQRVYRPKAEIEAMNLRDPIEVYSKKLIKSGVMSETRWNQIKERIEVQVDQEYQAAEAEEDPTDGDLMEHLLAPTKAAENVPLAGGQTWRMVDAVNAVFRHRLKTDPRTVFFGEDIEAPKGGVFGLTDELSSEYPTRVHNSPLAEATIAGVGIGMASVGLKPVFELQFIDFVGPAMNQIGQNLGTLRWRTKGEWKCPIVFYAPYGAYLPGGSIWHSQANESVFAHLSGMRVVVPSTPEDAAALMWTAMHADDPTVFLMPKHLFRKRMMVPDVVPAVGFGEAKIAQLGGDVTIVAWGNCMELAHEAAEALPEVSVEIIDLRTVQPWDEETVKRSVKKTGRLVVVQEDGRSCSVGQMIVSEVVNDESVFYNLVSAPQLISKPDVPIGFNPVIEYSALPSVADVIKSVKLTLEQ